MKEATGELNVTVITVVAIAAVAALFMMVIYPRIRDNIEGSVNSTGAYSVDPATGSVSSGTAGTAVTSE